MNVPAFSIGQTIFKIHGVNFKTIFSCWVTPDNSKQESMNSVPLQIIRDITIYANLKAALTWCLNPSFKCVYHICSTNYF